MADILKVTTPLVDKIPQQNLKPAAPDPSMPFNLSDVTRVTQTVNAGELLQQNTGLVPGDPEAPKILAELLSDPAVTASMIGSISLLQEVISLMPANNAALTQEIGQLFSQLLLSPEEIVAELMKQEESTTLFKGDLFDQLRGLLEQNQSKPDIANGVGVLLKALNATLSRGDVLESVANNLAFLGESVSSSPQLSSTLKNLADALRQPGAMRNFPELRQQVLTALNQLQGSVLFSPQMEKLVPLVIYNLSRYNDNPDFLPDALALLLNSMDGEGAKLELVNNLQAYLDKILLGGQTPKAAAQPPQNTLNAQNAEAAPRQEGVPADAKGGAEPPLTSALAAQNLARLLHDYYAQTRTAGLFSPIGFESLARSVEEESKVIDTLAKIISKQAHSQEVQVLTGEKVDKIIQSLLSSPSNFTPLLHFIVPVETPDARAFAEIWVDPVAGDDQPKKRRGQEDDATHMLMVFDVEGIGRFESELYVQGKRIALNLLCPPAYLDEFKAIGPAIRQAVQATGYSFESINIDRLERTHSLMEVFTDLPYKRTGIDVKI